MCIIICYVSMVLIFLAFEDGVFESNRPLEWVVQVFELIFLMLFTIDISLKTFSYGKLYWKDYLNIIDLIMIIFIFILLILDMGVANVKASMIFWLWGVLRIGRIYFIVWKIQEVKKQSIVKSKWTKLEMSDIKDPLDRVIEILVFIRDNAEEPFI